VRAGLEGAARAWVGLGGPGRDALWREEAAALLARATPPQPASSHRRLIPHPPAARPRNLPPAPPGVGKTTAIRELSRLCADELGKRVVIVDTSNEIGGDGDVPHAGIGRARRMQVPDPEQQHRVMIEAVENHMPEVGGWGGVWFELRGLRWGGREA
jgi:hypothetical protein